MTGWAAFDRPVRLGLLALCLFGVGLAGFSAVPAYRRLGVTDGLAFTAVAVVALVLAVAVAHGARWALALTMVLAASQLGAVVGVIWELAVGIDAGKARQLRRLGLDPTVGVLINLGYSAVAAALFLWFAARWLRTRRARRHGS